MILAIWMQWKARNICNSIKRLKKYEPVATTLKRPPHMPVLPMGAVSSLITDIIMAIYRLPRYLIITKT